MLAEFSYRLVMLAEVCYRLVMLADIRGLLQGSYVGRHQRSATGYLCWQSSPTG